jgi:hypothetical protein
MVFLTIMRPGGTIMWWTPAGNRTSAFNLRESNLNLTPLLITEFCSQENGSTAPIFWLMLQQTLAGLWAETSPKPALEALFTGCTTTAPCASYLGT